MDLRQLEYIVAIDKYGNITKAAEKLFVTPSALNQQLLKLEKDLGLELFVRNQRQVTATNAGQVYLKAAREILSIKQNTYAQLQDMAGCQSGNYHIGVTYDHGAAVFNRVYPEFHRKYPGIKLSCHQNMVPDLRQMLSRSQLDLAFMLNGSNRQYADLDYIHLSTENLLLGIPAFHPMAIDVDRSSGPQAAPDLRLLENDDFALAIQSSTMRKELVDPLFETAGYKPHIIMESSMNQFLEQLCASGICNCIIPQSQVTNLTDIVWFYLPGSPRFDFSVAIPKGMYLNKALQYFVELVKDMALEEFDFPMPERGCL